MGPGSPGSDVHAALIPSLVGGVPFLPDDPLAKYGPELSDRARTYGAAAVFDTQVQPPFQRGASLRNPMKLKRRHQ